MTTAAPAVRRALLALGHHTQTIGNVLIAVTVVHAVICIWTPGVGPGVGAGGAAEAYQWSYATILLTGIAALAVGATVRRRDRPHHQTQALGTPTRCEIALLRRHHNGRAMNVGYLGGLAVGLILVFELFSWAQPLPIRVAMTVLAILGGADFLIGNMAVATHGRRVCPLCHVPEVGTYHISS